MRRATSDAAWASVVDSLAALQAKVYRALKKARRPLTDEQLIELTGLAPNSVRPRRIELTQRGLVAPFGYRRTKSGRKAITWVCVAEVREVAP